MTYTSVCPPTHAHDEKTTCYTTHKCRCEPCVVGWRARNLRIRKEIAYGRYVSPFIDATPARAHVAELLAAGMTAHSIASAAGVNTSTICDLTVGRSDYRGRPSRLTPTIRRATAAAVLAVRPSLDLLADGALCDGRGVRRRLQALIARGWSLSAIGRQMGTSVQRVEQMITSEQSTAGTYRRVAALYELLWDKEPTATSPAQRGAIVRSVKRARMNGWAPPAAWDDIDIDAEPADAKFTAQSGLCDVDEVAVELATTGERVRLNRAETREVVKRLHPLKYSDRLIADLAGCSERTVLRIRQELNLPAFDQNDLIDRNAA